MTAIATFLINIAVLISVLISGNQNSLASTILSVAFLIFSLQYSYIIQSNIFRPLQFSFLLYWGYGFLLPGLYQIRSETFFWASRATAASEIDLAAAISLTATVVAAASYHFGTAKQLAASPPRITATVQDRELSGTLPALIMSGAILLYAVMLLKQYGPNMFFASRDSVIGLVRDSGLNSSQFGLVKTLSQGLAIGTLAVAAFLHMRRPDKVSFAALTLSVLANSIVNFPLAIPRYYLVAIMFVLAMTLFRGTFSKYKNAVFVASPAMLFLVFPTLGTFNRAATYQFQFRQISIRDYLAHGDLDGMQSVMNAVVLVRDNGLAYGERITSALLFFIPRQIWANKSLATGAEAAANAGYKFTNISMPLPGELYADGGILFVVVGMAIVSYCVARLETSLKGNSQSRLGAISAITLAAYMPILLRGSLLSTIQAFLTSLAVVVVWAALSGITQQGRASSSPKVS